MNGHVVAAFIGGSILLVMFAFVLIIIILHQKKKEERHLYEKQELVIEHQNTRMEEQEKLMSQISKEVHDNIGQIANLICTNLSEIKAFKLDDEEQKIVDSTHMLAERMTVDARSISHSLNSDLIKINGFVNSVKSELKLIEGTKKLYTTFKIEGTPFQLSPKKELVLFRIVQEALHNTLKHAKASVVDVSITYCETILKVDINDNGIGMRTGRLGESGGIGFINMIQRAKFLNGDFNVTSGNDCGVWIEIAVPRPGYEDRYWRPWP